MNLIGLVLSWSTISAALKASRDGSKNLDIKGRGIFGRSSRAKLMKPVMKVMKTVTTSAKKPLMMLKMLYAY